MIIVMVLIAAASMTSVMTDWAQTLGAIAAALIALAVIGKFIRGVYRAASRIESTFDLVNHELQPNGSTSLRDAVDRIETKADNAVSRAEDAATHAHFAAQNTAKALERIERLENTAPRATAIVVNPTKGADEPHVA